MSDHPIVKLNLTSELPLVLLGAGGHAKVIAALIAAIGRKIIGVCDPAFAMANIHEWRGIPVLGDDSCLVEYDPQEYEIALGIGITPRSNTRLELYENITHKGYSIPALVHPHSVVDGSAIIESGAQIMAGAIIQADCRVGKNTIINTSASVDHDCKIGDHTHIAPGVVICGGVIIGTSTFIGASATILPQVKIGCYCLVGAGIRVSNDLKDGENSVPNNTKFDLKIKRE